MTSYLDDLDLEALIDSWHDGYFSRHDGIDTPPACPHLAREWELGRKQWLIDRAAPPVAMPERPEGYYHTRPDGDC